MPIVDGIKHACAQCIRGHRTSTCAHHDRPLIPIRPKGRPPTQCVHCREARKAGTGSHSRCVCGEYTGESQDKELTPAVSQERLRGIKRVSPGSPTGKELPAKAEVFDCQCGCGDTCQCRNKMLRLPNLMNPCGCIDGRSPCTCQSTSARSANVIYFGRPSHLISSSALSNGKQKGGCCCTSVSGEAHKTSKIPPPSSSPSSSSSSCCSGGCQCSSKSGGCACGPRPEGDGDENEGSCCSSIPSSISSFSSLPTGEGKVGGCCSVPKPPTTTTPSINPPIKSGCCSAPNLPPLESNPPFLISPTSADTEPDPPFPYSPPSMTEAPLALGSIDLIEKETHPPPPPPLPHITPNHLPFQTAKHQCGDRCSCSTWASLGLGKAQCGEEGGACGCGPSKDGLSASKNGVGCCGDGGGCGGGGEDDPFEDDILGV